jgi:Hemerythrin HHE cation binding domain
MAQPAQQHPGASGVTRHAPVQLAGSGGAADIVELITADHRRIERLCRTLYDTARYDSQPHPGWMPGHVWQRLADLLAAHTQAEEQTCYASASCAGAQDAGLVRDSISDHDDIRKLIDEASSHPVGSAPWWHAVRTVMEVSAEHHEREERYVLPSCVLGLDMNRRKELGRQWSAYLAAWRRDPHSGTGPAPALARHQLRGDPFDVPGLGRKRSHGREEG